MGFDFAVSTTFTNPIIKITDNVDFYGVDHSPSVFFDTITRKISEKILNYIPYVIDNHIHNNQTLKRAVEIEEGNIINQTINLFQNR
jgi:alanine dehydrogenase